MQIHKYFQYYFSIKIKFHLDGSTVKNCIQLINFFPFLESHTLPHNLSNRVTKQSREIKGCSLDPTHYSRFSSNCENIPMPYSLLTFPFPGCCSVWIIQFQDCMFNFMAQVSLGLWAKNRLRGKVLNCGCNFDIVLDVGRNSRHMLLQLW